MGCDIHLFVEKREDGVWRPSDKLVRRNEDDKDDPDGAIAYEDYKALFYSGRNYDLFAMLASVRNGYGFAGVITGAGFTPIAQPKGLPSDVSPEIEEMSDDWGVDGHSHSHLTLRELLDYDWTQRTQQQGWVEFREWLKWSRWARGEGRGPEIYCGGVSGRDVKLIDEAQMDALVAELRAIENGTVPHASVQEKRAAFMKQHESTYALAQWEEPYYRAAGSFMTETIPRLLKLAGGTAGLDDVRIVFWFDN